LTTSELKPEEPEARFDDSTPWLVYKLKRICRYAVLSIYDPLAAPVFLTKCIFGRPEFYRALPDLSAFPT
jgi:hypothetical protein